MASNASFTVSKLSTVLLAVGLLVEEVVVHVEEHGGVALAVDEFEEQPPVGAEAILDGACNSSLHWNNCLALKIRS